MKQITTLLIILTCGLSYSQTNGLKFDGSTVTSSADRIQTSDAVLGDSSARTVEMWIKRGSTSTAQGIMSEWGSGGTTSNISPRFTVKVQNNHLRMETGSPTDFLEGSTYLGSSSWYHVAVVVDPTLTADRVKLYLNGNLEASSYVYMNTFSDITAALTIGSRYNGVGAFNGTIDDYRIWDIARTQSEIQADMNNEFCNLPANLIHYFKFNEGIAGGNNTALSTVTDEINPLSTNTLTNFTKTGTLSNFVAGNVSSNSDLVIIPASACVDYVWAENGQTYNTTGLYDVLYTNEAGCDSIMRLDLTINTIDNGLTDNGNGTLTANMPGVMYQWLDCDNSNNPISGLTSQTMVIPSVGNFSVEINNGGCLDTSNCINISSIPNYLNPAMNFDGTNDYVQTTTTGVTGNGARTVEAWINVPSANTTSQKIVADWGGSTTGSRFTTNISNQKLRLEVNGSGINGTTDLNDGMWHHIAVTYDPADNNNVILYVDGIQDGITQMTNINTLAAQIKIGARFDNVNTFFGDMDEVRVWNIAKTPAEILAGMNNPICTVDANLVSYFTFNEGTPFANNTAITTLKDYAALTETSTPQGLALNGTVSNFSIGPDVESGLNFTVSSETACDSYQWLANGSIYNASGEYFHTLTGANTCDSIVKLNLTINTVDNTVTDNMNSTMVANMVGATYAWLDCDNSYMPIAGANDQMFIANAIGNFSVEITANGCVDTSDCINVASIPDFINSAMHFDGSGDYIPTDFPGILGDNAITVEAMVKTDGINNEQVITAWGSDGSGQRFTFRLNHVTGTYVPRIEINGGGINGTIDLNDGLWHHVAVTYDPTLASNKYKLFVDGALDTEGDMAQTLNIVQDVNMYIGRRINPAFTGYFSGAMDEIRVWNVAKTEAELLAGKNGEICSQSTDLVAYFNLNDGTPGADNTGVTEVLDYSGNDLIGTPSDFTLTGQTSNFVLGPILNQGIQVVETAVTSCGDFLWDVDNATYSVDGDYVGTTTNMNGCDSIVKMNLTVYSATGSTMTVQNCGPYTWSLTGNTHSLTGFYNTTLQNMHGCDSMVTLALTVLPSINGATNNSGTLSATTSGANYQWINCSDNSEINGATNQTFSPTTGGSFAVIVDNGSYTDTSACMTVTFAGIDENSLNSTVIYPNPVSDDMTIAFDSNESGIVSIVDVHGKIVKEISFNAVNKIIVDMSEQEAGVYIVNIQTDLNSIKSRIIVK